MGGNKNEIVISLQGVVNISTEHCVPSWANTQLNASKSQFIIATYSPIPLSCQKAAIYEMKNGHLHKVS